jgi:hypothetical protein
MASRHVCHAQRRAGPVAAGFAVRWLGWGWRLGWITGLPSI